MRGNTQEMLLHQTHCQQCQQLGLLDSVNCANSVDEKLQLVVYNSVRKEEKETRGKACDISMARSLYFGTGECREGMSATDICVFYPCSYLCSLQ